MTTAYSNSQLQSYKDCPLQYHFYWELGLRQRDDEAADHHLRYGDAFHQGLAVLYGSEHPYYSMSDFDLSGLIQQAQRKFLDAYPVQLDLRDQAKTRANGVKALLDYACRWRADDKSWKVLEVETRSDDPWSVKPDMVVENVEQGGIYLVDHKTTGAYLNYQYWGQFQPNSQITHYLDYARSKYGPIDGFIINAIGFRFRERAYKGEPAGFWSNFERQVFNRNDFQIEHERQSRQSWIEDLERSRANGFWRTNTRACRFCSYRSICAPGWDWETDRELIEIQFRQACAAHITDGYCALDRGHDGECSPLAPVVMSSELVVEV